MDQTREQAPVEPVLPLVRRRSGEPTVAVNIRMPEALRSAYIVEAGNRALALGRIVTLQEIIVAVLRKALR